MKGALRAIFDKAHGQCSVPPVVLDRMPWHPAANAPVFLALTADLDPGRRRRAALQATVVAASVILVFALFVGAILTATSVSITAHSLSPANGHPTHEEVQYEAQINHLRHSRFIGLRQDKNPREVRRETMRFRSNSGALTDGVRRRVAKRTGLVAV